MKNSKKILVIGCPGGGKSTFARKLHSLTHLPLVYLDTLFWRKDRTTASKEEFDSALLQAMEKEEWIIDGNYRRTLPLRFERADTIFVFHLPAEECLQNAKNRVGRVREDLPFVEESFDEEFGKYILDFPKDQLPIIMQLIQEYEERKDIIIFHSHAEADEWLAKNYHTEKKE